MSTTPRPQTVALGKRAYAVAVRIWTLVVRLAAYISTVAVAPAGTDENCGSSTGYQSNHATTAAPSAAPSAAASQAL